MKKTAVCLSLIIAVFQAKAQTLDDPIYFNYNALPFTNPDSGDSQLNINYFETNLAIPVTLGKKVQLINAF